MRYTYYSNSQNRKANDRLEREDRRAGSRNPSSNANQNTNAGSSSSSGASARSTPTASNYSADNSYSEPEENNPIAAKPKAKASAPKYAGLAGGLKDQLKKEARVVEKLPNDFPVDQWESLNTKQQRQALKFSGLDEKEQWVLLNANAPLRVLDEYNQEQLTNGIHTLAATVASTAAKASSPRNTASDRLRSISTPLQKTALQRKLELQREALAERERQAQGRTTVRATLDNGASNRPAANTPVARGSQSNKSGEDDGEKKNLLQIIASFIESIFSPEETPEPANITPQVVTMVTVPPTASPKPTPTLTPSPTPGLTESQQRALSVVELGKSIADQGVKYTWGGGTIEGGMDCSGFIEYITRGTNLKFGKGDLSLGAKYMAASFDNKDKKYGKPIFIYSEDNTFPDLIAGDLIFSADPDNLGLNKHVTMATGNNLQVIEASAMKGVEKVTYQFDAYTTEKNGYYYRDSGQVITYVIRPNY